jgi:hypothetical protein
MAQTVEEWYKSMPVVTRTYLTLAFLTTAACALDVRSSRAVQRRATATQRSATPRTRSHTLAHPARGFAAARAACYSPQRTRF